MSPSEISRCLVHFCLPSSEFVALLLRQFESLVLEFQEIPKQKFVQLIDARYILDTVGFLD